MLTLLGYVLIVGVVAGVLFLLASMVFGRGEELGPLPEGTTATVLPAESITGTDVRSLRFQQVVRGYKAGEVDWALARLAARIDELQAELAHARAMVAQQASAPADGDTAAAAPATTTTDVPRPRTVEAGPRQADTAAPATDRPVSNGRKQS